MEQYIKKSALIAEIERRLEELYELLPDASKVEKGMITISEACNTGKYTALESFKDYIDTLEVKDPYEQCVQYDSIKAGIKAHAETYSFNIESELFNQLTKEQQKLWRKEIEQACVSGGEMGVELARDPRYKENLEVKEVDLEEEIQRQYNVHKNPDNSIVKDCVIMTKDGFEYFAKHFFELGMSVSNKSQKGE